MNFELTVDLATNENYGFKIFVHWGIRVCWQQLTKYGARGWAVVPSNPASSEPLLTPTIPYRTLETQNVL